MKKILFLHGFFATGSCPMARALKEVLDGQVHVLTPDLPLHPKEALKYIHIHSAFDSETQERMVVYQALYGEMAYWVRPEKMFFEKVTRDGRTFNRFTEIDR